MIEKGRRRRSLVEPIYKLPAIKNRSHLANATECGHLNSLIFIGHILPGLVSPTDSGQTFGHLSSKVHLFLLILLFVSWSPQEPGGAHLQAPRDQEPVVHLHGGPRAGRTVVRQPRAHAPEAAAAPQARALKHLPRRAGKPQQRLAEEWQAAGVHAAAQDGRGNHVPAVRAGAAVLETAQPHRAA
eukprot:1181461-Prorocentrum_minimum.AAC.2